MSGEDFSIEAIIIIEVIIIVGLFFVFLWHRVRSNLKQKEKALTA